MQKAKGALALDIDGTLTTGDADEIRRLVEAGKKYGFQTHINTARSLAYCANPDRKTSLYLAPKKLHHCLTDPNPPTAKVKNMHTIQNMSNVADPKCVVLIDDRPENVAAVRRQGFSAIKVSEATGIREQTVNRAIDIMGQCAGASDAPLSQPQSSRRTYLRIAIVALIVLLVVALFYV